MFETNMKHCDISKPVKLSSSIVTRANNVSARKQYIKSIFGIAVTIAAKVDSPQMGTEKADLVRGKYNVCDDQTFMSSAQCGDERTVGI